ncbi:MAG: phosphoglycerate kinase [Vicinamibacteria bacterium]
MAAKQTIRDLKDVRGTRIFVRVDFNVPMEGAAIAEDTRIRAALPTLTFLQQAGAELVLASHLGRPKKGPTPALSLAPVGKRLAELMKCEVDLAADSIGDDVRKRTGAMKPGSVVLLENLRFHPEEEANDPAFAKALIDDSGATVFVNDAFGTAHRAHASTAGVAAFVKHRVAGLLMEKEIHYLGLALASPPHPYVAIIGGAKVSDKITVIENLLPRVDTLLIGGGMAYTFFKALDYDTGKSLVEADKVTLAAKLLDAGKGKILLPFDHVVASAFKADAETKTLPVTETPEGWMGLDIGPETVTAFGHEIQGAALVLWNGPMGVFEMKPFSTGTFAVAQALASSKATTIVGGGDSVAAISEAGLMEKITHVSTGGGASLEFLGGDTLPGVECLDNDPNPSPVGG